METTNFDDIKDHFKDDPQTQSKIVALERALKKTDLYGDLLKHDAIKMIVAECERSVIFYNRFLASQSSEELATPAGVAKRARYEGYREAFDWFARLFALNAAKSEALSKKVEDFQEQMNYGTGLQD